MSAPDDFEARLRDWLRDRGLTSDEDLRALAGNVAVLPPRRPNRWRPLMLAATVVLAVALGIALVPRFGGVGGGSPEPSTPRPPDPAAFAGDPRLASCGGLAARVTHAFELPRARDYRLHLPAMGLSPELDVDAPAFVVVFEGASPFISTGGAGPRVTNAPGHRDLCILVAEPDGTATRNLYTDVDIGGLTASGGGTPGPHGRSQRAAHRGAPAGLGDGPARSARVRRRAARRRARARHGPPGGRDGHRIALPVALWDRPRGPPGGGLAGGPKDAVARRPLTLRSLRQRSRRRHQGGPPHAGDER